MEIFNFIDPTAAEVPILISVPHSGTFFPENLIPHYIKERIENPDDTDWYVDRLYDFAPSMGISMIKANYHRWVIDLNRHPSSEPLYNDGRNITELCPTSTFNEEPIYHEKHMPDGEEIERRVKTYYKPYYNKIESTLNTFIEKYDIALLWDAHSIKQYVPGIRKEVFPDLILGDNDEKSAGNGIIDLVLNSLSEGRYNFEHNNPFKGGNITRYFGKPEKNQHALQLEMTKINYMGNDEMQYDKVRAAHVRKLLTSTFSSIIEKLPHERI